MISKKTFALSLAALAMGLASCGGGQTSSSESVAPSSSEEEGPSIPVVEGKTAVYFELDPESPVNATNMPSYVSPFATGVWNAWATGPATESNGIVEFTRLEETNIYYGYIADYDDTKYAADRGYQLALGYNESAQVGDMAGMNWTYKSVSCASYVGLGHPTFPAPTDGIIKLTAQPDGGEESAAGHQFETAPAAPVVLHNWHIAVDLSDEIVTFLSENSGFGLAIKGSFDSWGGAHLMDFDLTEKTASYNLGDVIAGNAGEMCIAIVNQTGVIEDKYNLTGDGAHAANSVDDNGIYHLGNLKYAPLKLDGDDYVGSWGTLSIPEFQNGSVAEDEVAYVYPESAVAITNDVLLVLVNSGEEYPDTFTPHLAGAINSWSHTAFEYDEELFAYALTISATDDQGNPVFYEGVGSEFKITDGTWTGAIGVENENAALVIPSNDAASYIEISFDFALLGTSDAAEASLSIVYGELFLDNLTITLEDSGETGLSADVTPAIPGAFNGWDNTSVMTADGDDWTYVISYEVGLHVGVPYEFKVTPEGSWDGALCAEGNGNASFILSAETAAIILSGDLSLLGGAGGVLSVSAVA